MIAKLNATLERVNTWVRRNEENINLFFLAAGIIIAAAFILFFATELLEEPEGCAPEIDGYPLVSFQANERGQWNCRYGVLDENEADE